ncbi:MAG: hypothetical protein ABIT37_17670 [Luteolibacter sp.]
MTDQGWRDPAALLLHGFAIGSDGVAAGPPNHVCEPISQGLIANFSFPPAAEMKRSDDKKQPIRYGLTPMAFIGFSRLIFLALVTFLVPVMFRLLQWLLK